MDYSDDNPVKVKRFEKLRVKIRKLRKRERRQRKAAKQLKLAATMSMPTQQQSQEYLLSESNIKIYNDKRTQNAVEKLP